MQKSKQVFKDKKTFLIRGAALVIPFIFALLLLSQTVLAQNKYVITDGDRRVVHRTYASDPAVVLGEAGLELGEDDTYTTQQSDGVSEIFVRRGEAEESPDPAEAAFHVQETYTESIPHDVTYCDDHTIPVGETKVLVKGEDGEICYTADVTYENGEEISRIVTDQRVMTHPVTEVIAKGSNTSKLDSRSDRPIIGDGIIITPEGDVLTYTDEIDLLGTAYTCDGYVGTTATGTRARFGEVAIDPRVVPYGTRMYIVSEDGQIVYGIATAEDCGGLIIGNRVDLYYETLEECYTFGCRNCKVYILG